MKILGVDPGLAIMGYGLIEVLPQKNIKLLEAGVVRTSSKADIATRLKNIYNNMSENMPNGKIALSGPGVDQDICIVCEGPWDAAMFNEFGVCIWGANMTGLISNIDKPIILALDNDDAGRKATDSVINKYRNKKLGICLPPDPYKDWNEMEQADGYGVSLSYVRDNYKMVNDL